MKRLIGLTYLIILIGVNVSASASVESHFKSAFGEDEGCFYMMDLKTRKIVQKYNETRCQTRFIPASTFKIPIALMAFDSDYFKTIDQVIKWDGKQRSRKSLNQNQTPVSFIKNSVVWVSQRVVNFLGRDRVLSFINSWNYGNQRVEGKLDTFWLSAGSIKISATEQVEFLRKMWSEELPNKKAAIDKTKQTLLFSDLGHKKIFGKTGTGCIDKWCINRPGRQLGRFVGILQHKGKQYAFAINFSSKKPMRGYAGPRVRDIAIQFFNKFYP